jgi:hypothetical protein
MGHSKSGHAFNSTVEEGLRGGTPDRQSFELLAGLTRLSSGTIPGFHPMSFGLIDAAMP